MLIARKLTFEYDQMKKNVEENVHRRKEEKRPFL